jgi:hypothetical protein
MKIERIDWLGLEITHALGKWKLVPCVAWLDRLRSTYKAMQLVTGELLHLC